ncbi:type II toxin-antitoxin system antitoxin SocA domain-containing protein [Halopiger thermotolerans]
MTKIDTIDRETDLVFLSFYEAGDVDGLTKIQKLLFLLEQESELAEEYPDLSFDFEAYDYGPFSEQVYDEIELLVNMGALEPVSPDYDISDYVDSDNSNEFAGKRFRLTEKGQKISRELSEIVDEETSQDLSDMMEHYNEMSTDEILEYVYEQYPEYARNSKIKEEVLD